MRLGLHTYSYRYAAGLWEYTPTDNEPMTAQHFLRKAAELSLDGVSFCDPRHFDSSDYGSVASLRDRAEALGLWIEVGTDGTDPDVLQEMVRTAHVLGSPTVRASVDSPRAVSHEAMKAVLEKAAGELTETVPLCKRYGVSISVENTPNVTTEELLTLVGLTGEEWVRVCFDTGDPLQVLEDPLATATALAPFISSVHLKDYQVTAKPDGFALIGCPLGDGIIDLVSIIDLLSVRSPEVSLSIETATGRRRVAALGEDYLMRLPRATAVALGRTLRLVRDRGTSELPPSALERGASEDEVLAAEDEQVVRSTRWVQRVLGRPEAEDLQPGE